jgi:8-oxo-dGTP pyrophosphatase MutT (NUDIX family)
VGGHADPGEDDPAAIARREAEEETGLTDLTPFPDPAAERLVHVVVVPVPAGRGEPAHEHADLRYLFTTATPDDVVPESATAGLRGLSLDAAHSVAREENLRVTLGRAGVILASSETPPPPEVEG